MRALTFKGFLTRYLQTLSHYSGISITRLTREMINGNLRLKEPLYLYCLLTNKQQYLLSRVTASDILAEYQELTTGKDGEEMLRTLVQNPESWPLRYQKVYHSYLVRQKQPQARAHTKSLMHAKIIELQKKNKITAYRICSDLRINPGNFQAFIKHSAYSKLSLSRLRIVISYLQARDTAINQPSDL